MKPYGKKELKSTLGIHSSGNCGCAVCNNGSWTVIKSRERHHTGAIDEFLTSEEISALDEADLTAKVVLLDDEEGLFEASCNLFDERAIAIDPDEALEKLSHILHKKYETT